MNLSKLLAFAAKARATQMTLEVGEYVQVVMNGQPRTVFATKVNSTEFESQFLGRLGAFEREELRTTGRCAAHFEEQGVGTVSAEVTPKKATLTMPVGPPPAAKVPEPSEQPRSESRVGGLLGAFFGRKSK